MIHNKRKCRIRHKIQILISVFLTAMNTLFAQTSFWYDFSGTASLEINYTNNTRPNACKVSSYKMFPEEYTDIIDTLSSGSGKKTYKIPVSGPQSVTLTLQGIEVPILLIPGASLACAVDFSDIKNVKFQTTDSLSLINGYLLKRNFSARLPSKTKVAKHLNRPVT